MNYRQCYISRMPQQDTGAFWNATVYSPRDPKMGPKLALATKQGLDPKLYGGFSSQQFAYFFIYEAEKKGKPTYRFSQVPVWLAARIEANPLVLEEYARGLAESEGLEYVDIQRSKIYKKQLIELNGERFFITGKKAMANNTEIAFSLDDAAYLERYVLKCQGKPFRHIKTPSSADKILNRLLAGEFSRSRLFRLISLDEKRDNFELLSDDERGEVLIRILSLVNGTVGMADLRLIGGSKFAGYLQPNYSKLLNDPKASFFIIDQSVTGMFERKTRVGL